MGRRGRRQPICRLVLGAAPGVAVALESLVTTAVNLRFAAVTIVAIIVVAVVVVILPDRTMDSRERREGRERRRDLFRHTLCARPHLRP